MNLTNLAIMVPYETQSQKSWPWNKNPGTLSQLDHCRVLEPWARFLGLNFLPRKLKQSIAKPLLASDSVQKAVNIAGLRLPSIERHWQECPRLASGSWIWGGSHPSLIRGAHRA